MIGSHASAAKRGEFARLIEQNPRNYIAQPILDAIDRAHLYR